MTKITQKLTPAASIEIKVGSWWKYNGSFWLLTSSLNPNSGIIYARVVSPAGIQWTVDVEIQESKCISLPEWHKITSGSDFKPVVAITITEE